VDFNFGVGSHDFLEVLFHGRFVGGQVFENRKALMPDFHGVVF
jgi:hypothetical protein